MQDAGEFAANWIAAWNAHDLDRILALYSDDFEMSSPYISEVMGEPSGVLQGKPAIRAYWSKALAKFPDLSFELINVLAGANSIVINYYGRGRRLAAEAFFLDAAGKIVRAAAHYA